MKKLVSVIIPAYNHENYILECLESVINQTYVNMQLIIVNDGSQDDTERIINEYIENKNFDNIEFYSKENEGLCKTINFGLKKVKGDYVAILASDDLWKSDKIERQVSFLEENKNIALVYSDTYIIKGGVSIKEWTQEMKYKHDKLLILENSFEDMVKYNE